MEPRHHRGASQRSLLPPDQDFALSDAGIGLAEALAELEWARPELAAGVSVELGPVPWDDVIAYGRRSQDCWRQLWRWLLTSCARLSSTPPM